jgi:chromate reductase
MKSVLAISGSLRRESLNRRLLAAAQENAPAGMSIRIFEELGAIPMFDEDFERAAEGGPPAVRALRDAIAASDGLLISTPEYNQSIPGGLKNAIDWLSRPAPDEVLVRKPVAVIGASSGRWGTRLAQAALRQVLNATESLVMPQPMLFVSEAAPLFDAGGHLVDEATRRRLAAVLAALDAWIGGIRPDAR